MMKVWKYIRKNWISIIFVLYLIFLVLFSKSNFNAAKKGLILWANNVVPSLFPFFVAAELLNHTNFVYFLSIKLEKTMKPIFNLPGVSAYPFIMGLISGYPVGAKIVSDLYEKNLCSKEEAERMLAFTNNSGPLFIVGTVGYSFYSSSCIGIILLCTHILASITVGIIFGIKAMLKWKTNNFNNRKNLERIPFYKNENYSYSYYGTNNLNQDSASNILYQNDIHLSELGGILGSAIISAIKSVLMIGGFVTIFSVVLSILDNTHIIPAFSSILASILHINSNYIAGFLTGFLEFTNGLYRISEIHAKNISTNLIISAFILGFGGISVTLQVLNIIFKNTLSIKPYVFGKLLHGAIASLYTFLILSTPLFNFNL